MKSGASWRRGTALQGAAWLSASEVVQRLLSLVLFLYLSRKVSIEQNGWYGLWASTTPFFIVLINLGGSDVLLRDAAAGSPRAGPLRMSLLWTQAVFFAALLAFTRAGCLAAGFDPALQAILLAGVAAAWCWTLLRMHLALLMAEGRFAPAGLLTAAARFAVVAGALALLFSGFGVWAVCWWVVPVYAAAGLAAWRISGAPPLSLERPDKAVMHYGLREGLFIAAGGLAATAYYGLDMALLQALVSPETAGYYALGTRFFLLLMAFPEILTQVIYPLFCRSAQACPVRQTALLARVLKQGILAALPAALGVSMLAGPIVSLLAGERYGASTAAVVFLTWTWVFEALNWIFVAFLRASGRQRTALYGYAAILLLKGALGIILVPHMGTYALLALNAALSAALTLSFAVVSHRLLPGGRMTQRIGALLPPMACACAALVLVVWVLKPLPVVVPVLAGAAVYGVAIWVLGLVTRRDRVALRMLLGRKVIRPQPDA